MNRYFHFAMLLAAVIPHAGAASNPATTRIGTTEPVPESARDYYNQGTQQLNQGKLREAEALLESALAAQEERLQPAALYNLGHTRFAQGVQELKRSQSASSLAQRSEQGMYSAKRAVQAADEALRLDIVEKMVAAYIRGRGARKELRAATTAVTRAMEAHSATLLKWQRASGDFGSAAELSLRGQDARQNQEVVDRHIARLVDSLRQLQEMAQMLGKQKEELQQKLKQLKGRIPEEDMPPGASGDDEEDEEEKPPEPKAGEKEAAPKEGQQTIELSPELANWLLEGFRLDRERRLPMGGNEPPEKNHEKPNW